MSTYPEAGLVRLVVDGDLRLQIRPSGTEPKVKLYGEGVDVDRSVLDGLLAALAATAPDLNSCSAPGDGCRACDTEGVRGCRRVR